MKFGTTERVGLVVGNFRQENESGRARHIVLIPCVKRKRQQPAPACQMYVSPLFSKCLEYARLIDSDHIFILSAKHGLIELDTVIEPYELTLRAMPLGEVREWAQRVLA